MLVRIMIFNQSFKTVVDAYDALLETRAAGGWEDIVCVFDFDCNTLPLFRTSCLNFNNLKQAVIESKKCVMLEHDVGYVDLYNDGKLMERAIRNDYLALSIIPDDSINMAEDALHFQQNADFNYSSEKDGNPWKEVTDANTGYRCCFNPEVVDDTSISGIAGYFKEAISKLKSNRFLIEQASAASLVFTLVDKKMNIIDSTVFLLEDLDQFEEEYEIPLYTKSSSKK